MSKIIETSGGFVYLEREWLDKKSREELFEECSKLPAESLSNSRAGKIYPMPRLNYSCGDSDVGKHYYSNTESIVNPWTKSIENVRNQILKETGHYTDSCLLNYYRNGEDYVAFHSDKEVYGPGKIVVTLSLGATRKFEFRKRNVSEDVDSKIKVDLNSGDVVIMYGDIQDKYTHSILKQSKNVVPDMRISLTFRLLSPSKLGAKGIKIENETYVFSRDFKLELPENALRY